MSLRKIEVQTPTGWLVTEMKDIKKGDTFRLTEPNEDSPFGLWMATGDAYCDHTDEDGTEIWGVNCEAE